MAPHRQWTFAALTRDVKGDSFYVKFEYATDTKIIQFKKIMAEAKLLNENWSEYLEERQTVENKQKYISQIMTSKSSVRSCEDVD